MTCDEYPFASSQQSSAKSWVGCILGFQNTAGGSKYIRPFLQKELNYEAGCPYIMQIDPTYDCTQVQASSIPPCTNRPRRVDPLSSATNGVFYDPDANSPGMLIIALGDIPVGR